MASCSIPSKEGEGDSTTLPNWLELPRDITANILRRLDTIEIVTSACHVCPLWWNICKDPLMWRTIHMTNLHHFQHNRSPLVNICRYAIERSCGHLENIDIQFFGTDDLLEYIAENGNNLRCMRLVYNLRISDYGLSEVVRKLPHLEELDISLNNLSEDSLKVVGRCCPLLKSLKFARMSCEYIGCDDDVAFVIAETMHGLRHLDIEANKLTNDGLLAILDACPLLESLELEACFNLDLSGKLGKRCREQIKFLRMPIQYDSEDYYSDDDNISYSGALSDDDCNYPYDLDSEFGSISDDEK